MAYEDHVFVKVRPVMFSVCFLLMYTTNLQVVAGEVYNVSMFQFSGY